MRPLAATLIPIASAVGYSFAAIILKRASDAGMGPWRATFIVNWTAAIAFAPWWLLGGKPFAWVHLWHAALAGAVFFVGQILTFLAISKGDVSITTPVLGSKVIFVAFLAALLSGEGLSPRLWMAAFLTSCATALLGGELRANRQRVLPSLSFGLCAALAYATTDVLQLKWAPAWGFGRFSPVMFATVGLLSLTLLPLFDKPLSHTPSPALKWNLIGALLLSLQAFGIAYSIVTFKEVTLTNILYNSRGVWSVLLVWLAGSWFGNTERLVGNRIMARRLAGALLLLTAIFLGLNR